MPAETLYIDGGRGDDHLQVRPFGQDLLQHAEQEVDVQRTFVRLVNDQRVVGIQVTVLRQLGQEHAVGHQLDETVGRGLVGKAHLEADQLAQGRSDFLGNARGHGTRGNAARLRVADQAVHAAAGGQSPTAHREAETAKAHRG